MSSPVRTVLVINMARIGDIVQAGALVQGLHQRYPGCRVDCLVNSRFAAAAELVPGIDRILPLDFSTIFRSLTGADGISQTFALFGANFDRLRARRYDRIVNITPHFIGVFSQLLSGRQLSGLADLDPWERYFLAVTRQWKNLPLHLVDLHCLVGGVTPVQSQPQVRVPEPAARRAAALLGDARTCAAAGPLVALHCGGSTEEKKWPSAAFAELGERVLHDTAATLVPVGVAQDRAFADTLARRFPQRVINLVGQTDLAELAAVLRRVDLCITTDSAPMHIAAGVGTRVLSLHSGKEQCVATGPCGADHIALEPAITCHPCATPEQCPDIACRALFQPARVAAIAAAMLTAQPDEQIHGCAAGARLRIRRSGVDSWGLREWYPLVAEPLCWSECARRVLKVVLLCSHGSDPSNQDPQLAGRRLRAELQRYYHIDRRTFASDLHTASAALASLQRIAGQGAACADALCRIAAADPPELDRLRQLDRELRHIDARLAGRAEALPGMAPLVQLHRFCRDEVGGRGLGELAANTRQVYTELTQRIALTRHICAGLHGHNVSAQRSVA